MEDIQLQDQVKNVEENDFVNTDCDPEATKSESGDGELLSPLNVQNPELKNNEDVNFVRVSPAEENEDVEEILCEKEIDGNTNLIQTFTHDSSVQKDAPTVENEGEIFLRQPCLLDFNTAPVQLTGSWRDFESSSENFLKGCKWAPDGTCILTCSDDNIFRLFNLPYELYSKSISCNNLPELSPVLRMNQGETIYDYCWYPQMSSFDPATCCFISTCRDHPLQLWDAFTGQVRCSYRAYNDMDEIISPHCVAFNLDGSKIFCGFNKMVRVFDTSKPGRQCEKRRTVTNKYGQSGIISCIAFSPDNNGLYACGSFSKSVGIYCEPKGNLMSLVEGHKGGVTQLLFSPDAQRLYSGGRKDDDIICWDIRMPGVVLYRLIRSVTTNQRMYFDIDSSGKYLISGNSDGSVSVWDTSVSPSHDGHFKDTVIPLYFNYIAHDDCVNGISLHPTLPLLATASGQRKFEFGDESEDDDDCIDLTTGDNDCIDLTKSDYSLRLWQLNTHVIDTTVNDDNNIDNSNTQKAETPC